MDPPSITTTSTSGYVWPTMLSSARRSPASPLRTAITTEIRGGRTDRPAGASVAGRSGDMLAIRCHSLCANGCAPARGGSPPVPLCRSPVGSVGASDGASARATLGRMVEPRATSRRSIAVVGAGYVGLVSAVGFAAMGHDVELVETDPDRLAALHRGEVPFTEAGVQDALTAALAAGTLSILERASATSCTDRPHLRREPRSTIAGTRTRARSSSSCGELAGRATAPTVVVRSTLPVGTCERLLREGGIVDTTRFFTVPEFLRQGAALADFRRPSRVVIGCRADADPAARDELVALFGAFDAPLLVVTLEESELIKNGANAFLALKISFANEIAGLAERAGADAGPVLQGIGLDPRIGSSFFNPSFGFGGSCLPKELATIAISGNERGLEMHVTSAAAEANQAHQRQFAERIAGIVGGVDGTPDRAPRARVQGGHGRHPLVAGGGARPVARRARRGRPRVRPGGGRARGRGGPGPSRATTPRSRRSKAPTPR